MSIIINGTELGSTITLGNTSLSKITFNNTPIWESFPAWDSRGLKYNSWDTIQKYIQAGLFSTVAQVGNTKTFVAGGKTYTAEVVAINDGTGNAAEWYPDKTVDFICKELLPSTTPWDNFTSTIDGYRYTRLKREISAFYQGSMPSDLKSVIIDKYHKYLTGQSGNVDSTADGYKTWAPTAYELFGQSYGGENDTTNKVYTLASKSKALSGGLISKQWWTASCHPYDAVNNYNVYTVNVSGRLEGVHVDLVNETPSLYMPLGFRIG